jgi:hypothetical protein
MAGFRQYGGHCRMLIVNYGLTCKIMNKIYIRNMQQHFKMRMKGHFQDVKKLMEKGVHSNSYAWQGYGPKEPLHQCRECNGTSLNVTFYERAQSNFCCEDLWEFDIHSLQ